MADFKIASINDGTFEKIPPEVRQYFTAGNRVDPLFAADSIGPSEDDIWTRTDDLIRQAASTIQIEMYDIDRAQTVDLLLDRARQGVQVQIVMDPPTDDAAADRKIAIDRLRQGGVEVLLYPIAADTPVPQPGSVPTPDLPSQPGSVPTPDVPSQPGSVPTPDVPSQPGSVPTPDVPAPKPPTAPAPDAAAPPSAESWRPLDHVKMLLVDGRRAIIGGMNWGTHSPSNHDFDVAIEGPAVAKMEWLFREDWLRSGGAPDTLPPIEVPAPCGDAYVNLVISANDPHEHTIAKAVLRAVRNARRSIHAELFALTEYRVIEDLKEAHARGVDVKVILDPLKIGTNAINERACNDLRRAGICVKWFVCNAATLEKMHAKTGLFDDDQVIVGSANWTTSGFNTNREADVEILSREVNQAFERQFQADWDQHTADAPTYLPDPATAPPVAA